MKSDFLSAYESDGPLRMSDDANQGKDVTRDRLVTSIIPAAGAIPNTREALSSRDTRIGWGAGLLVFLTYTLIWNRWVRPFFFPWGDDFAVMANSLPVFHPHVRAWFLEGFRHYFQVYPDRTVNLSDFIRPGVNATFYAEWFLFHSHWALYLLTTYAAAATIAGLVYGMARRFLAVSSSLAVIAALAVGFAPSMDTNALWDPAFAFDLLAGAFVLAGVAFLLGGRYVSALLVFTFACFTKETALFSLPVAALIVWFRTGNLGQSLAFLVPLAAWGGLRWHDFHGTAGVYVTMGEHRHGPVREAITRLITGASDWPVATQVFRKASLPLLRSVRLLGLVANVGFWVGGFFIVAALARRGAVAPRTWLAKLRTSEQAAFVIIPVFCAASLILPLVLDVPRRFGASFFPLFVLTLITVAQYASTSVVRTSAATLVSCVGVSGILLIGADLLYLQPQAVVTWQTSHAYIDALHSSKQPILLVVDDNSSVWSAGTFVQQFAGYPGRLIRINDLNWNKDCAVPPAATITDDHTGSVRVIAKVSSSCGSHDFVNMYPTVTGRTFSRDLKEAKLTYDLGSSSKSDIQTLTVTIVPRENGIGVLLPTAVGNYLGEMEVDLGHPSGSGTL